jgi:hypothetical protein
MRLLLVALLLSVFVPSMAMGQGLCAGIQAYRLKDRVELPGASDKYKHCTLSCMLALRCGPSDSISLGLLKEIADLLGYGTPDIEDIRANAKGIGFVVKFKAFRDSSCHRLCRQAYPY